MITVLTINYILNRFLHLNLYQDYSLPLTLKIISLYETRDVFWTIFIEFRFYLVLPAMIFLFRILRNNVYLCTVATGYDLPV